MKKVFLTAVAVVAFSLNVLSNNSDRSQNILIPYSQENITSFNRLNTTLDYKNFSKSDTYSLKCWVVKQKVKRALRDVGLSKEDAEVVADVVKTLCEVLT